MHSCQLDARNHYPRIKHHTPPPSGAETNSPPPPRSGMAHPHRFPSRGEAKAGLLPQSPTVCLAAPKHHGPTPEEAGQVRGFRVRSFFKLYAPEPNPLQKRSIQRFATISVIRDMRAGHGLVVLLRKEVIQPHLPVRLPCYDFVPIADPTFDGSLPRGVRPPASGVTDFHDVTGGVYKARERIHRSVADLRLLATPTSRGRVADPDPN
jgi:hypothetical protein